MKRILCTLSLILCLGAIPGWAATPPAGVLSVAVFDFEASDDGLSDAGKQIALLASTYLSLDERLSVVERAELEKLLGEQELGLSGTIQADTAAKVGQLTGAKVLVTGRVFETGGKVLAVAKIIGTETGRVYGAIAKGPSADAVDELATELAAKIGETVGQKGDTLIAPVKAPEERLAKLKELIAGKKLPSFTIKIEERHFGGPVIDPAAETELAMLLEQCGFRHLEQQAAETPEVRIVGEAFSAYGMRKGNLYSCRARVELKVIEVKTGRVLVTERQTSVAVDLAEQTAAKSALQNAASELANRLIPRIAQP